MVSEFLHLWFLSSTAGPWAVTSLLEPTGSLGKVSGVVTGQVGKKKTDS